MNLEQCVKVVKISEEKENILKNLVSLYLHDLSEFADDLKINEGGRFEYDGIEYYFNRQGLKPFLIYCNNEIAGFILLNTGSFVPEEAQYSIHELFILKSFRKKGIATMAIKKYFKYTRENIKLSSYKIIN